MAPKPASTAGKAPASTAAKAPATASKAPSKTTEKKAGKKTSKAAAPADGEKKKRKKSRKETYSSYIYKGASHSFFSCVPTHFAQSSSRSTPIPVSRTRRWLS